MMMRRIARQTITNLVSALPENTRHAVMGVLATGPNNWEIFQAIGREYQVRDITVVGSCGVIEGSLNDERIMAEYAKQKNWHVGAANHQFIETFGQHQSGTYIDIGANLGLTLIPIAALPHVDCKGFEPDPTTYRYLRRNVAANCPNSNVQLINAAVGDRSGQIEFELDMRNPGDNRIHTACANGRLLEETRSVITVSSFRLDDMFDDLTVLKQPIIVKMDVQGAEGLIFAGGKQLLAECTLVLFEYWPYSMKRFGSDINSLADFIKRTFSSGSMVQGDHDIAPTWEPIDSVVEAMLKQWPIGLTEQPFTYHEIYLRK